MEPYPHCTCPDYDQNANKCKHIFAVEITIRREREVTLEADGSGQVTATETVTITATKRVTYKQVWPAYNAAQTHEKDRFQELLAELCRGIGEPPGNPKGGRQPVSYADRVFSAAFKSLFDRLMSPLLLRLEGRAREGPLGSPAPLQQRPPLP
jgi:hypothetical protein